MTCDASDHDIRADVAGVTVVGDAGNDAADGLQGNGSDVGGDEGEGVDAGFKSGDAFAKGDDDA